MNNVEFVISKEEDLALGPGTKLDHSRALQSFIKVRKGTEKASDTDIRKGVESAPSLIFSKGIVYFLISYYTKSKERLKFVKTLPDLLSQFTF